MLVGGTGSITLKGLEIFNYCKINDVALEFGDFYVSDHNVSLATLTDSAESTYNNMTAVELEDLIDGAGKSFYSGTIQGGDQTIVQNNSTVLPLLMTVISNAIEEDINLYTCFLTAKDPTGFKVSVADTTGFSAGNACTDQTTGATATIEYVDSTNNYIYIKNVSPAPTASNTFEVGNSIEDTVSSATATMTALGDAFYVIHKCCLSMDERLTVIVADSTNFSVSGYISSENGAKGTVTAKNGNTLTVNRTSNAVDFAIGDNIDNAETYSAAETTIAVAPYVDTTASTPASIPYISDGSDILLRISIRYSSGFPRNLVFQNTAITEIQIHNVDENDTHIDLRLHLAEQVVRLNKELRDMRVRLEGVINSNGLNDPNNVQ